MDDREHLRALIDTRRTRVVASSTQFLLGVLEAYRAEDRPAESASGPERE